MSNKNKALCFTLFDLEKSIANKNHQQYEALIIQLFNFMDQRSGLESIYKTDPAEQLICTHQGLSPLNNLMSLEEKQDFYSRLAASITHYLSDPKYTPSNEVLLHFLIFKNYIADVFYLSCYSNMDHILFNRGLIDEKLSLQLQTEQDIKYLYVCLTLNSDITFDAKQLAEAVPRFGMYWYLGMLYGFHHPYNSKIENNFNKVFEAHSVIKDMAFDSTSAELAAAPWMLCSYLDRNDRHDMKISINAAMEKWVSTKLISPGANKKIKQYISKTDTVKKIVVLSEQYKSPHAMYRCYHPEFEILKENFQVICIADPEKYDELSSQDFHQIINIKDTAENLSSVISEIIKLEPDLIYFPSLGMAKWTIPLANMRLAKYQIMCYGHPASAFSRHIDYSYCSEPREGWDFQQFCMEKIVPIFQGRDFIWEPHPDYETFDIEKPNDGVVRIAINSSLPKITPRFIQMCRVLLEHSSVPIEFNFFLVSHDTAFEKSVNKKLAGTAKVHPPADYMTYMKNLSICDLAIGTFPFGGSNTNTDIALLGIPKVFYSEGCGLASYSDQTALDKLNPPDILTPKTEGELLANLIYLIHDKTLRDELSKQIKDAKPYDLFYAHKTNRDAEKSCRLVNVIHWIEENHLDLSDKENISTNINSFKLSQNNSDIDLGDQLSKIIQQKVKDI